MDLRINSRVRLNHGVEMPRFGLGVWQLPAGDPTRRAVEFALRCGYRLIDTAKVYGNERDVGEGIRRSGVPRSEVFVTTKVWNGDQGYRSTLAACTESLTKLGLDALDLYLIHWPVEKLRSDTWKALVKLQEEGRCRAIGVSNYTVAHLEELVTESSAVPSVNQVEFSPYLYQRDLFEYCRKRGIVLEAYSPLTKGARLSDRRLTAIASKYRKSPAQVLIRWALQKDVVVIPRSRNPEHIRENGDVFGFELSAEDMRALDSFDESLRTSWDPSETR